jgi:Flp pilus assembly protein TadG
MIMNKRTTHSGIAAIELAVVMPFLIIVMLVGVDLAKTMFQYNELVKNVRDASKYLAGHTRPMNCASTTDPEVLAYKTVITETKNLAVCGELTSCVKASVTGLSTSKVQVQYLMVGSITMVKVGINSMSLSYITKLFSGSLALGNISSTFYQPQLDTVSTSCNQLT